VLQNVHQLRRLAPPRAVPALVKRRLDKVWENDAFRAEQEAEMRFLLGCSERASEIPELAYAYAEQMMTRAYMRWHPKVVTSQRIKGLEFLSRRDESRSVILSFMHHHRYEAMFGSILRAGGPPTKVVVTEAITKPEAGIAFAQHMRVARRGGPIVHAEIGTQGLAAELTPGVVMGLAPDFPGRTPVTFLGRKVLAPFGTPRLAQLTNSQIVVATNHRDDEGPYVQLHAPIEPADYADPTDLLVDLLGRFEQPILEWPEALESPRARFGEIPEDASSAG
jgi:lauroyl/myristoyl acyltransferase